MSKQWLVGIGIAVFLLTSCTTQSPTSFSSLTEARQNFKTSLRSLKTESQDIEIPPNNIFQIVKYPTVNGELPAYLSTDRRDGKKYPAIIWITGGDCNSIGDVWSPAPRKNDQTASAFRKAGIIMMFPSLRGGNNNPGKKEGFLGEVDDLVAAVKYLQTQNNIDPTRIYLGGHSTGGTMALLVAEYSTLFRGIFAFGPIDDVSGYGDDSGFLPFDTSNQNEVRVRSPKYWLSSIKSPTWIFEGDRHGNIESLRSMAQISNNLQAHFLEVKGADHFSILAPTTESIANKIILDTGEKTNIAFSAEELNRPFR
jgi:dipeptidyl aminopeptidase/acylaminoacyl peptidase